ncbi:anthranilate synthase family protein [Nocardia sp. NPDC057353]|uniref:anthranilate synthase family protein n=1 Tax=Nocardia sp. NPDC057353 TaxID=3346104 RepID=UPI003645EF50
MSELLIEVLEGQHDCFALLCRDGGTLDVLTGRARKVAAIADIPLPDDADGPAVLAAVPYRQITERGFACHDDGAPLTCLLIEQRGTAAVADAVHLLPAGSPGLRGGEFTTSDSDYAQIVKQIVTDEIAHGAGANFVIRRDFRGRIGGDHVRSALVLLRRLLRHEVGAYWTFAFVTPEFALVGATPERHVSAEAGTVLMNPISGTFRHPGTAPDPVAILEFLGDRKETDELFMVVDEELKMMAAICDRGGQVLGPSLKQMGNLTHTEYLLRGHSTRDVRDILRATMFAPTVTGSPIENAARVIHRYEDSGRGYYSGVLALLGRDEHGQTLDAPILIRTCELHADGTVKASVGATLVRASDPVTEVAETHAKLAGVLQALGAQPGHRPAIGRTSLLEHAEIRKALAARNGSLARFWLDRQPTAAEHTAGEPVTATIVDCEDEWSAMLGHQLRHLGLTVQVRRWSEQPDSDPADLLVMGPGPGDPTDAADPRIARIDALVRNRLRESRPLLAVCLSHQLLAARLGLRLLRLPAPNQGSQHRIDLFGRRTTVGLYNSFTAVAATPPPWVECSAAETGAVHALRGPGFASVQFHPESVLTTDGTEILGELVTHALAAR